MYDKMHDDDYGDWLYEAQKAKRLDEEYGLRHMSPPDKLGGAPVDENFLRNLGSGRVVKITRHTQHLYGIHYADGMVSKMEREDAVLLARVYNLKIEEGY